MAQKAEQETVKSLTPLSASHTWAHLPLVTSLLSTYHIKTAESPGVGGGWGGGHLPLASGALISELLGGSIHSSVCGLNIVSLAVA